MEKNILRRFNEPANVEKPKDEGHNEGAAQ